MGYLALLIFLRTRQLKFLACVGNWKQTINPCFGLFDRNGDKQPFSNGFVMTLVVLCSAPFGVVFLLSLLNKASVHSREGLSY